MFGTSKAESLQALERSRTIFLQAVDDRRETNTQAVTRDLRV